MSIGQTTSFTGFNILETFNSRLQPDEIKASSSAGTAIDITYNFVDPVRGHNEVMMLYFRFSAAVFAAGSAGLSAGKFALR